LLAHPTSARAQACVDDLTGAGGELGDRDRILFARAPVLVRVVPVHCARPCAEPLLRRRRGCSSAPLAHGTDGGAPDGRGAALDSAGANTCVEPVRGAAREGHAQPLWPLAVCGVRCAVVGAACVQSVCERRGRRDFAQPFDRPPARPYRTATYRCDFAVNSSCVISHLAME
jgi:hypothetical protein